MEGRRIHLPSPHPYTLPGSSVRMRQEWSCELPPWEGGIRGAETEGMLPLHFPPSERYVPAPVVIIIF